MTHLDLAKRATGCGLALVAACRAVSAMARSGEVAAKAPADNSDARPLVTEVDRRILQRARELLDAPAQWNRKCPAQAPTVSLSCALERATVWIGGKAEHRGTALQEVRFVIDKFAFTRNNDHRLMDYNIDPSTTFADIQEVLRIAESIFTRRLSGDGPGKVTTGPDGPTVSRCSDIPSRASMPTRCASMIAIRDQNFAPAVVIPRASGSSPRAMSRIWPSLDLSSCTSAQEQGPPIGGPCRFIGAARWAPPGPHQFALIQVM